MESASGERTVSLDLGDRAYEIVVGAGIGGRLTSFWTQEMAGRDAVVITDDRVGPLYAGAVRERIEAAGARSILLQVPAGETSKSFARVEDLCDRMARARIGRSAAVVALGGGVVGDLAGFVAAVYMRGVDFVQVPTTLLAMVDSSVGGKVAVDLESGKNLAGAFHQPRFVLADLAMLRTLPRREWLCGASEVAKYGAIMDEAFFRRLESLPEGLPETGEEGLAGIVAHCCELKAEVVRGDERESGRRAILNFGHTIGHALENLLGYGRLLHGEAVAVGMCCEAELGRRIGWTGGEDVRRIRRLLDRWGLPTRIPADADPEALIDRMRRDKKAAGGRIRFSLLKGIGTCEVTGDPPEDLLGEVLRVCRE